jgi:hypothetical protein
MDKSLSGIIGKRKCKDSELPIRLIRKSLPKIHHVKRPKKMDKRIGANYQFRVEAVDIYTKPSDKDYRYDIEHEIAHHQIEDKRRNPLEIQNLVETELLADLVTYARIGQPKNYYKRWSGITSMSEDMTGGEYPVNAQLFSEAIKNVAKFHWKKLPEQWRLDYYKWLEKYKEFKAKAEKAGYKIRIVK